MAEIRPHVEQCPGCIADRLTDEDRDYLRSTGWVPDQHVLEPLPELDYPKLDKFGRDDTLVLAAAVILMGLLAWLPWLALVWILICAGLIVARRRNHNANHPSSRNPACGLCRRARRLEAGRTWAEYQRLREQERKDVAAARATWHRQQTAAHYQRLLDQQRQRGQGA